MNEWSYMYNYVGCCRSLPTHSPLQLYGLPMDFNDCLSSICTSDLSRGHYQITVVLYMQDCRSLLQYFSVSISIQLLSN